MIIVLLDGSFIQVHQYCDVLFAPDGLRFMDIDRTTHRIAYHQVKAVVGVA